ncbi:MAG: hypothetical protein ACYCU5_08360 [Actinomycetes bacterium]
MLGVLEGIDELLKRGTSGILVAEKADFALRRGDQPRQHRSHRG